MEDTTFQFILNPLVVEPGEGEPNLLLAFMTGIVLPAPGGQAMAVPSHVYRIPLNKSEAEQVGQALLEVAAKMKAPSKLVTASNIQDVDRAAQDMARFTG